MDSQKIKHNSVKSISQIFTPKYIAGFMVNNLVKFIQKPSRTPNNLKILEPSVGEGVFLEFLQEISSDITAYELDRTLKKNLLDKYPEIKFRFKNFLGSNTNENFDIIIGNPPYLGQNYNAQIFQDYVRSYPLCKKFFVGNMDLFYFFIHMGIEKLNPGGLLSFITTNYWITKSKKTGIKFLKPHILEECFVLQYIDLSNLTLFKGAEGQHNCIFVIQKKTEQEKLQNENKLIEIIQINKKKSLTQSDEEFNKSIFKYLTNGNDNHNITRYTSAKTNNELETEKNWNLKYPEEIKELVEKIENQCQINGKTSFLNDYFIIRNGLIFIKDQIFILNEGKNLKIEDQDFYIIINEEFTKLNETEKDRLKKIYKSKSIRSYGYIKEAYIGYAIYFNKSEFKTTNGQKRNQLFKEKYPHLIEYLDQFKAELQDILINAKENPIDMFFPRRGTFIRINHDEILTDLEPLYDLSEKIFLRYISNDNTFGYSNTPYYATSDTYFLWPRFRNKKLDYTFMLAYFNSNLVKFIFKAKNIFIKRSKTKLEHGLPIPNLNIFKSERKKSIIALIKLLSYYIIKFNNSKYQLNLKGLRKKLLKCNFQFFREEDKLPSSIYRNLKNKNQKLILRAIDILFYNLFSLREEEIDRLIQKFY
ncbi:hypothetical protein LCGC14_1724550 [marine sediment metagenome]|uniref:site-specific DNA-methyltransferase (adenine-specific) n=1 Tax=marine sediment metagenome TaxID=412755 RepID=A0A0F9HZ81_9ZZZZ|nr:hypothetical protein [bacterium]